LANLTVGVLDSGIGGLTLLEDLLQLNLDASYLYISDAKNVPYGEKTQSFMLERISLMIDRLLEKGANAILIACNTATAETIDKVRSTYSIQFVGIEPYINYLNHFEIGANEKVALILTHATFQSAKFKALKAELDPKSAIDIYPMKNLAMFIESLKEKPFSAIQTEVEKELSPLKGQHYTHLILGCTHYAIIENFLASTLGLKIVDPSLRVAERVRSTLNIAASQEPSHTFLYSEHCEGPWVKRRLSDFSFLQQAQIK